MTLGGFSGTILHIDLTNGIIHKEPLDPGMAEGFLGGLGLTVKLAYDGIKIGAQALSPDNLIVLGVGPLVGTNIPATSRVYAVTKFPASGTIGWCGGGGVTFGCLLKNAGYDHVVIEGRAQHPVVLNIVDDDVEICDARDVWGKGVEQTYKMLRENHGMPTGVISIGQAGENQVSFSMAYIDRFSTLGRGGFGAVMGSKNLKAVTVQGTRGIKVADRKNYRRLNESLLRKIREYPYLKEWQDLGLAKSLKTVPIEIYRKIKKRRMACVSCPIGDKDVVEIPDGDFEGLLKCSSSVVNLFGPITYGIKDYREAVKCMATLDDYGLDKFEFFGLMDFAKTLDEQGIIPKAWVQEEIRLDSLASLETWAGKISLREQGLGHILADGFAGVLREFGENGNRWAPPLVKGMFPYVGPQGETRWHLFGTMELGQLLDPRGPHVASGGSPTFFAKRPLDVFPRHLGRMGAYKEAIDRILPDLGSQEKEQGLNIGRLLKHSHTWFTILGSLGICARAQINRFYDANLCADLYSAVTGIDTNTEALIRRAERAWTLLRMANVREGYTKKDETIPEQWFGESGFKNYLTEDPITRKEVEKMIGDYYDEWGWDVRTGVPKEKV